ncbi:MAG: hypothetical protein ACPGUV_03345 [Polyangiales bacterium]
MRRLIRWLGRGDRIWLRLLLVNVLVLLVPVAGIEFAHLYERQLLHSLEQGMWQQAQTLRALW